MTKWQKFGISCYIFCLAAVTVTLCFFDNPWINIVKSTFMGAGIGYVGSTIYIRILDRQERKAREERFKILVMEIEGAIKEREVAYPNEGKHH